MRIILTPQSEETIRRLVRSGRFKDSSAVVDEALRALDERERLRVSRPRLPSVTSSTPAAR